jgi:hypothetical protein
LSKRKIVLNEIDEKEFAENICEERIVFKPYYSKEMMEKLISNIIEKSFENVKGKVKYISKS